LQVFVALGNPYWAAFREFFSMILKLLASRGGRALLLIATVAMSFLMTALVLRHGMKSWPDSWYDWEGSVNLIEHGAYTTMLGVTIHEWPPLYSLYLALFERLFGQTGWALIVSMCVLVALNVAVWGAYVFKVFPADENPASTPGILGSLVFLICFLPLNCISLLPNALLLLFVGLILHLLAAMDEDPTLGGGLKKALVVGLLLGMGVFTHNSAVIYIAATITVILLGMHTPLRHRLMAIGLILLMSGSAWIAVPHGLGSKARQERPRAISAAAPSTPSKVEEGTHYLFDPKYSFGEYLVQTPVGFGVFFIPVSSRAIQAALGVVILATAFFFVVRRPETKLEARHRIFLGFALLAVLGHFAIFNIIWLDTVFGDRFAWYFALIAVPIFFCRFRQNRRMIALLLLVTVGVSGYRLGKIVRTGAVPVLVATSNEVSLYAIHPEYFLTSEPHPIVPAGAIQIEAPVYRWQNTASGAPAPHVHETVTLIRPGTDLP
jgi:hypothetical protein